MVGHITVPVEIAFIRGRFFVDEVILYSEIHMANTSSTMFKFDFEKRYDKTNCNLLKGFHR